MKLTEIIKQIYEQGTPKSQDIRAISLPLLKEVNNAHLNSQIYLSNGLADISFEKLKFGLDKVKPQEPRRALKRLFKKSKKHSFIEGRERLIVSDSSMQLIQDFKESNEQIERPIYLTNLIAWEEKLNHYDALTDIYKVGLILSSIAFNLDLSQKEGLNLFIRHRDNLSIFNPDLHPTIINILQDMTELYREDRIRDIPTVIQHMTSYQSIRSNRMEDLTQIKEFKETKPKDRQEWIISILKSRLYDISKRNKLLYYTYTKSFINLTISSVPILLDVNNIREDDLCLWNNKLKKQIINQRKISLTKHLNIDLKSYLVPRVDKIRLESRKSANETGINPTRLVIAYLHWYNFKEDDKNKILSPLLLLPVQIIKKKGLKDQFDLHPEASELEVNPVLSHYLHDLFGIKLPEVIDLTENSITDLIATISTQIDKSQLGVNISLSSVPKINLLHIEAKNEHTNYSMRMHRRKTHFNVKSFDYSYENANYKPLGLEIFNSHIKSDYAEIDIFFHKAKSIFVKNIAKKKRTTNYIVDSSGTNNPYEWIVDTCNITLGNFNYRKMGLVNDYDEILEKSIQDSSFDELFSDDIKKTSSQSNNTRDFNDDFSIIANDPTQLKAVKKSIDGLNYIIQGPPGTGKSQTITNLIARFIAEKKRVLFVCEKRAALDVVYHRMAQHQLNDLCCLVHDAQSDKKAFIMDLKEVYEKNSSNVLSSRDAQKNREKHISTLEENRNILKTYHEFFRTQAKNSELNILDALNILVAYDGDVKVSSEWFDYPNLSEWIEIKKSVGDFINLLDQSHFSKIIANHPFVRCDHSILTNDSPANIIIKIADSSLPSIELFSELCDEEILPSDYTKSLSRYNSFIKSYILISPIAERNKLSIFDESSHDHRNLKNEWVIYLDSEKDYNKKAENNYKWKSNISKDEISNLYIKWLKHRKSLFKYISPTYYKLRKILRNSVGYSKDMIEPDYANLLKQQIASYEEKDKLDSQIEKIEESYGIVDIKSNIQSILSPNNSISSVLAVIQSKGFISKYQQWEKYHDSFSKVINDLHLIDPHILDLSIDKAENATRDWKNKSHSIGLITPFLLSIKDSSKEIKNAVLSNYWTMSDIEYAAAYKFVNVKLAENPKIKYLDGSTILSISNTILNSLQSVQDSNVKHICSQLNANFVEKVNFSDTGVTGMSFELRNKRNRLRNARKILENEFGKKIRYKSIRDLSASDAQELIIDLKPVWLMSPSSVSDILPLNKSLFDVVIYDEASQITLEDGVPSLFRAKQTIIVGDEMQMPPTQFFNTRQTIEDYEIEEGDVTFDLSSVEADSLLNQGARKLDSVMLGWHYRSRHESLIAFCNAAFYGNNLLTIPDNKVFSKELEPMTDIVNKLRGNENIITANVLSRSISYHHIADGLYSNRSNKEEAEYIALFVRSLLINEPDKTIGIVAFSMQQQFEIDEAIESLATEDKQFEVLLEDAYNRIKDHQYVGLFVKNLENVQGDERDVMILSICYGPNDAGRMLMNFGPINQNGGEKRLNVILSRAKQHMAVVSTIQHNQITNEHNQGALFFKRFLHYAENISEGNIEIAQSIIDSLSDSKNDKVEVKSVIINQLKDLIQSKGYECKEYVGQSRFQVDLAIKKNSEDNYCLGIILDDKTHYESTDIIEQYCQKPQVLRIFGWDTYNLFIKDWFINKDFVINEIERKLSGQATQLEKMPPNLESTEKKSSSDTIIEESKSQLLNEKSEFIRLEFVDEYSNKFWQYKVRGNELVIQFGRINSQGQERIKTYKNQYVCESDGKILMNRKIRKGYKLIEKPRI